MITFRKLLVEDLALYKLMQTGLERDYMLNAFERLVVPPNNHLFGLIKDGNLISVAGYTLYPGGYAMLGRLRSDVRFRKNGYATMLLEYIIDYLDKNDDVVWMGGNTNIGNLAARNILNKLGFDELKTLYGFPLIKPDLFGATPGSIWASVNDLHTKRMLLNTLSQTVLDIYPYECYYPFPYHKNLISDEILSETRFYQNAQADRWLIISDDTKKEDYIQVRYFWDDYFTQAGLLETILADLKNSDIPRIPWFDFTPEAYQKIPNLDAFEVSDGWVLYGKYTKTQTTV